MEYIDAQVDVVEVAEQLKILKISSFKLTTLESGSEKNVPLADKDQRCFKLSSFKSWSSRKGIFC